MARQHEYENSRKVRSETGVKNGLSFSTFLQRLAIMHYPAMAGIRLDFNCHVVMIVYGGGLNKSLGVTAALAIPQRS